MTTTHPHPTPLRGIIPPMVTPLTSRDELDYTGLKRLDRTHSRRRRARPFPARHHSRSDRPDFTLLVGPEELPAETVMLGGHGGFNGGANLFPLLYVTLYEAAVAGNRDRVAARHAAVMQISDTLYSTSRRNSCFLEG